MNNPIDPARLDEIAEYYDTHDTSAELRRAKPENDTESDPMVSTSLRLPKSLLDWVREQADAEHIRPTALIRRWLEQKRDSEQPGRKHPADDAASVDERVRRLEEIVLGQGSDEGVSMSREARKRRYEEGRSKHRTASRRRVAQPPRGGGAKKTGTTRDRKRL
ncbi:hypothetical protein [Haloactinomyces albus]|uniref:Uncharacterized protein n=1 Tax=Haloactinomyces albus TaxID=1352928 RepID=A0AAE3ZBG8_9ACTN|nr:hypothetical protein [Haloactinomyces albus]MDR7301863.1 hypothetical protein [Haloactinomyces albus]